MDTKTSKRNVTESCSPEIDEPKNGPKKPFGTLTNHRNHFSGKVA